ncbi:MAG TPA: polysaccharide biosynthesis protein [Cyanobacteria bacterium UBA11162]|nr:polysaccharide biosynthesis protein [Cyanobacteria bacterium UBA11162]
MNFNSFKSRIVRLLQKPLVRNTFWMLLSQGLKLFVQAAYFVMIARALGTEQYGAFVGITSLVAIVTPFANLGSGDILVKNVSRNRALFKEYWGNALFICAIASLFITILVLVAAQIFLGKSISLWVALFVALSDLFFLNILSTAAQAFISVGLLKFTAQIYILYSLKNFIAAIIFIQFLKNSGIEVWSFLYLASTAISALGVFILVNYLIGSPKLGKSTIKPELTQGFLFSVSLSAKTINNNIDKTMLASLSTLAATGIYAAAYRLIDVAFVPVTSLAAAAYAKFFQQGEGGIRGSLKFAKRLLPIVGGYGFVAGLGLFLLAPVVPYILGGEYVGAVDALRWLAPIPCLKAIQYLAADSLTGAGFQWGRSAIQVAIALFNLLINLWLIPAYSWKGAAWASLASDGLLMLSLWGMVFWLYRQELQKIKSNEH